MNFVWYSSYTPIFYTFSSEIVKYLKANVTNFFTTSNAIL